MSSVGVVGCGVIGLFTCRELLKQCPGVQIRVYASRMPRFGEKSNDKLITSQVAPGLWFPFHYGRENDTENQKIASLSYAEYDQMSK
jgi:glycine/D-amino acid oxidase-like deaminating enzyme